MDKEFGLYVCRAEACRLLVTTFLANLVIEHFVSSMALPSEGLFTRRTGHRLTSMMLSKPFFLYPQSVLELLRIINAQATTLFGGSSWPNVSKGASAIHCLRWCLDEYVLSSGIATQLLPLPHGLVQFTTKLKKISDM